MRLTNVIKFYASHVLLRPTIKATSYHNRGKPRRVLRDDGSDYFAERNITQKEQVYRRQLQRLNELEQLQLTGQSNNNNATKTSPRNRSSHHIRVKTE